jgi:hypothetical protein
MVIWTWERQHSSLGAFIPGRLRKHEIVMSFASRWRRISYKLGIRLQWSFSLQ